jgi:hypothetical protein
VLEKIEEYIRSLHDEGVIAQLIIEYSEIDRNFVGKIAEPGVGILMGIDGEYYLNTWADTIEEVIEKLARYTGV